MTLIQIQQAGEVPGFRHLHSAHCESGVTSSLLANNGFEISEPLAFGIGSGIYFAHFPFFKVMNAPVTTFRTYPGTIFKKVCKRLGIEFQRKRYSNPEKGMAALSQTLARGMPVGLQTNIFWLPYFPRQFRFQFGAHNLIAYGESDGKFRLSDPVVEAPVDCDAHALSLARFSKGPLSPRGLMYYPTKLPQAPDFNSAIREGIKDTCQRMLKDPFPFLGVSAIRYLAEHIRKWPQRHKDFRKSNLYLGNVVRMQEEIGTGGAGFRFLYAAFLQEAGQRLANDRFLKLSEELTAAGDVWRQFAAKSARIIKQPAQSEFQNFNEVADVLMECYRMELKIFLDLRAEILRK
jgi:hypothetical protein